MSTSVWADLGRNSQFKVGELIFCRVPEMDMLYISVSSGRKRAICGATSQMRKWGEVATLHSDDAFGVNLPNEAVYRSPLV